MNDDSATGDSGDSGDSGEDLIDWEHLAGFADGDREFAREMIALFLENAVIYVDELEARDSHDGWKESAHKIKGAARSIGARHVDAVAVMAESFGPEDWLSARARICRDLRFELDRLRHLGAD